MVVVDIETVGRISLIGSVIHVVKSSAFGGEQRNVVIVMV